MLFADAPGGIEQPAFRLDLGHRRGRTPCGGRLDGAAELCRHGHLAVADAEHGTPESKIACGARGEPASCTDSGARRTGITASASSQGTPLPPLERHDFGVDALLGTPARDQFASPGCQNRRSESCHARGHRRRDCWAGWAACHAEKYATGAALRTTANDWTHILLQAWTGLIRTVLLTNL